LFIVEDEKIREYFEEHFKTIFEQSERLLCSSSPSSKEFNHTYYRTCQDILAKHLGDKLTEELMSIKQ